jgi:hypothetical protein
MINSYILKQMFAIFPGLMEIAGSPASLKFCPSQRLSRRQNGFDSAESFIERMFRFWSDISQPSRSNKVIQFRVCVARWRRCLSTSIFAEKWATIAMDDDQIFWVFR